MLVISSCADNYPTFDADNAFEHLENQCELGVRYPGSDGIELCRDYIINELTKCNAKIELQKFTVVLNEEEIDGVNILASFYPQMSRRILLGRRILPSGSFPGAPLREFLVVFLAALCARRPLVFVEFDDLGLGVVRRGPEFGRSGHGARRRDGLRTPATGWRKPDR